MYEIREESLLLPFAGAPSEPHVDELPRRFRVRLLAVLGLTVASSVACGGGHCDVPDPVTLTGTHTLEDETASCPATRTSDEFFADEADTGDTGFTDNPAYRYTDCGDAALISRDGAICTYEVECTPFYCCGYGRPYFDEEGAAVAAGVADRDDWSAPCDVDGEGLTAADRRQLAAFWLHNAAAEHSSVAGFHRFALDLLAHGAPPELVRRAGQAASQEITHALDGYTLASAYLGRRVGPGAIDLGTSASVARDLAELAAWTVRDGIVGETIAAYLAARALEQATDPEVRRVLEVVVRDETAHAELAWETVAWALEVGGDEVRRAVQAVFRTIAPPSSPAERSTPGTVAHGILSPAVRDAATRECIDAVLRPVMASLLARGLAA